MIATLPLHMCTYTCAQLALHSCCCLVAWMALSPCGTLPPGSMSRSWMLVHPSTVWLPAP
jgi:hypothetical protein